MKLGWTEMTFSPETPRRWDPDHIMLKSPIAPHEVGWVLRLHRAGWPGEQIVKEFRLKGSQLASKFRLACEEEIIAKKQQRPIHDAFIKRGMM